MKKLPPPLPSELQPKDLLSLQVAKRLLEQPSLAIRLANMVGSPLERGLASLPKGWAKRVQDATQGALQQGMKIALKSLGSKRSGPSSNRLHQFLAAASGGAGGAFGLPALVVELPVSTTIMLRSIADIARSEGHELDDPTVKVDCLSVFALGSASSQDDAAETGYWATRAALALTLREAASMLASHQTLEVASPALARLLTAIASRFGVAVSEQVAAKAVPILGIASGAAINVMFLTHFQNIARGHFILRRLEARYGVDGVRRAYTDLPKAD